MESMSIEVYCKRFGVEGKVIPQMVLTSFLGFFAQERNQIFPFFCLGYIKLVLVSVEKLKLVLSMPAYLMAI